jgi:hypothetical protein
MTLSSAFGHRSVRVAYIIGAGILGASAMTALREELVPAWILLVVVLAYFGPLGIAALLIVIFPILLIFLLPTSMLIAFTAAVAIGVAALNVVILRHWSRRRAESPETSTWQARVRTWDPFLGAAVFVLAGSAFILLSIFAGFAALTAHGVDVRVPDAQANKILVVAALTWLPGLAIAVAGLVLWIVKATRGRPVLPWAIADLVSMVALIAALILGST